jgi:hypothetical protein
VCVSDGRLKLHNPAYLGLSDERSPGRTDPRASTVARLERVFSEAGLGWIIALVWACTNDIRTA